MDEGAAVVVGAAGGASAVVGATDGSGATDGGGATYVGSGEGVVVVSTATAVVEEAGEGVSKNLMSRALVVAVVVVGATEFEVTWADVGRASTQMVVVTSIVCVTISTMVSQTISLFANGAAVASDARKASAARFFMMIDSDDRG